MKRAMLAALAALLPLGCATMDARWDTCEKRTATFVELADCTIKAVHSDAARWSQDTLRMRSVSIAS